MRWRLWLAQSNTENGLNTLLRVMVAVSALWTVGAGYGAFAARRALQATLTDAGGHRQQAEQTAREARQKQETVALAGTLRIETPDSVGSPEWADAMGRLAQESGVAIESLRMTLDNHAQAAPAANAPNGANPGAAIGTAPLSTGNQGNGIAAGANGASAANGTAKDPDDGWKKSKFECIALGGFRELSAFLDKLGNAPYVIEIAGADMISDRYNPKTDALRLRLKLTLTLFGLPKQ